MSEHPRVLVCFGDSNTYGSAPMTHLEDIRRHDPNERWPGVLATGLGSGWHVVEEGLPGRTTVHPDPIEGAHLNGIAAVPIVVGSHSPIDAMVMMLGVNDFKTRFSVTAHDIATSVEALVACHPVLVRPARPDRSLHSGRRATTDPRGRLPRRNVRRWEDEIRRSRPDSAEVSAEARDGFSRRR